MKTTDQKKTQDVKLEESALLSLVASRLKDRILFPELVQDAKRLLNNIKNIEIIKP